MTASRSQFRLARVVGMHGDTADLWFLDDGWRVPRAPIMCESASNNSGSHEDHDITPVTDDDPAQFPDASGRFLIAVVGNLRGFPVVLGFLPPTLSEMIFADKRFIRRFDSDVYMSVDKDGNAELFHPSGAFVRIGEAVEHEDLTGKDARKLFKLRRNTGQKPSIKVAIGLGEDKVCSVLMDSTGAVSIEGNAVTLKGTIKLDGDVTVIGNLTAQKVTGAVDVVAGLVSLGKHTHGGVMAGPSVTTIPIPSGG